MECCPGSGRNAAATGLIAIEAELASTALNAARKRSGCVDRRGGEPAMGISASARSASAGARRIDRRDRVERDHCRHRSSASEREVAKLTVGLGHDVSTVLGIGRQRGSQPRANTAITIMRAPQRGHGQGSTRRASGVISGCFCGSAGGTIWSSARAVAMFSAQLALAKSPCAYRLCHPNIVPMETAEPSD